MECLPTQFFKCLSDNIRLRIVLLLANHGKLCVCQLHETLKEPQPKVSRHLAELRRCKILLAEKHGKWVHYQINPSLPAWAQQLIDDMLLELPEQFPEFFPQKVIMSC